MDELCGRQSTATHIADTQLLHWSRTDSWIRPKKWGRELHIQLPVLYHSAHFRNWGGTSIAAFSDSFLPCLRSKKQVPWISDQREDDL